MIPDAGYAYFAATAAHAALAIARDRFGRVVLLGLDHRVGLRNASVNGASCWRPPLGTVPVGDFGRMLRGWPELFATVAAADRQEHSLEVTLPLTGSSVAAGSGQPRLWPLSGGSAAGTGPETPLSGSLLHYSNSGDTAGDKIPWWDMAPSPFMEKNACKTEPTTDSR